MEWKWQALSKSVKWAQRQWKLRGYKEMSISTWPLSLKHEDLRFGAQVMKEDWHSRMSPGFETEFWFCQCNLNFYLICVEKVEILVLLIWKWLHLNIAPQPLCFSGGGPLSLSLTQVTTQHCQAPATQQAVASSPWERVVLSKTQYCPDPFFFP